MRPRLPGSDLLSRLNSIQLRHADIKNCDLRVMPGHQFNGFPSISGFRHNFEVRLLFEQEPQPGSNDRVVVSEQYANLSHDCWPCSLRILHLGLEFRGVRLLIACEPRASGGATLAQLNLHKQPTNSQNV